MKILILLIDLLQAWSFKIFLNPKIKGQLAEIRTTTLSRMICESSEYAHRIQPNAFLLPDELV